MYNDLEEVWTLHKYNIENRNIALLKGLSVDFVEKLLLIFKELDRQSQQIIQYRDSFKMLSNLLKDQGREDYETVIPSMVKYIEDMHRTIIILRERLDEFEEND